MALKEWITSSVVYCVQPDCVRVFLSFSELTFSFDCFHKVIHYQSLLLLLLLSLLLLHACIFVSSFLLYTLHYCQNSWCTIQSTCIGLLIVQVQHQHFSSSKTLCKTWTGTCTLYMYVHVQLYMYMFGVTDFVLSTYNNKCSFVNYHYYFRMFSIKTVHV